MQTLPNETFKHGMIGQSSRRCPFDVNIWIDLLEIVLLRWDGRHNRRRSFLTFLKMAEF